MRIAITGCGPAGLAAALMLFDDGHDIVIFERFETARPVGSGIILQPTGLAVLRDLNLSTEIHAVGKRIDLMHGISMPAGKEVLRVNYSMLGENYHGLAVHRAGLFDVLHTAARTRKIRIVTDAEITGIERHSDGLSLLGKQQKINGRFDLVVDASGAGTILHQHANRLPRRRDLKFGALWGAFEWPGAPFDENTLSQRYVGAHTMIGVLPIGRHAAASTDKVAFFWSIRTADYEQWLRRGLDDWKHKVRAIWPETDPILRQITDPSQMALARYGHSTMGRPFADGLVFLGDAAHSTSPQLGQGANMALLDAWSFAAALRNTGDANAAMRAYAAERRWHVRAFQLSSLMLTPFYQSDSRVLAALRDLAFHPASKMPLARHIVAGLISGMLARPPKGLFPS